MSDLNTLTRTNQNSDTTSAATKTTGMEHSDGTIRSITDLTDPEVSKGVAEFLQQINEPKQPEPLKHTFIPITADTVEVETEIHNLSQAIDKLASSEKPQESRANKQTHTTDAQKTETLSHAEPKPTQPKVYSSLFSLAKSFSKTSSKEPQKPVDTPKKESTRLQKAPFFSTPETSTSGFNQMSETRYNQQEKEKGQDQEGFCGDQEQQQQQEQRDKARALISKTRAARSAQPRAASNSAATEESNPGMQNIYYRFMDLMARILGQAEAEAHALYQRIKERTDNIDLLTLLISKINSANGAIDWKDDDEMKELLEVARQLGVDIPEGKLEWSEEEKHAFKENIQMRKDSMEKITQLERTDMQRYLQEASQCHQARSNVLKLLKEVMDTIIHNMRP